MAEITKTRTQLIERAATQVGVLTSNTPLEVEDSDTIDNLVDPLLLQLSLDRVVDVRDTDAIPAEYFLPVAMLLANTAATSFGQQFNPEVKLEQERILRRLTATRPTYAVIEGVYY